MNMADYAPIPPFDPKARSAVADTFKELPSYRSQDESIASAEVPALFKPTHWKRSPETERTCIAYWDRHFGGRVPKFMILALLEICHDPALVMEALMKGADKNGDGFVDKNEWTAMIEFYQHHYPGWEESYEEFVAEADVIVADGKVSVEEAVAWAAKMPRHQ